MAQKFLNMENARLDEQRKVMALSEADGVCPFCKPHLGKYHYTPILIEGKYWMATPNAWPYKNTKQQILLITTMHVENISELPAEAGTELIEIAQQLIKDFNIPGGALGMRFGDAKYSAGTVKHLHAQLIQPDIEAEDYQPVRFKIGGDRS